MSSDPPVQLGKRSTSSRLDPDRIQGRLAILEEQVRSTREIDLRSH